jgi:hypothetical protein
MKRLIAAASASIFLVALTVIPAGAGQPPQSLEVRKVIVGPVPPGAEFIVQVQCVKANGPPINETLTFTEPGSQIVDLELSSLSCIVAETQAAGATVSYACESVLSSTCISDSSFTNISDVAQTIVTVTNTYPEAPPPPPPPIEVGPTFTG